MSANTIEKIKDYARDNRWECNASPVMNDRSVDIKDPDALLAVLKKRISAFKQLIAPASRYVQNIIFQTEPKLLELVADPICQLTGSAFLACRISTMLALNSIINDLPSLIENARTNEKALEHLKNIVKSSNERFGGFIDLALDEYGKNRYVIENVIEKEIPWVLDDLDPSTEFDEQVRERLRKAIGTIDDMLTRQGFKRDTLEYNDLMVSGIYYLAATPPKKEDPVPFDDERFDFIGGTKFPSVLNEFKEFLNSYGGFRIDGYVNVSDWSALEALQNGKGQCTEDSKVLFAFLKTAGFAPFFVEVLPGINEVKNEAAAQYVSTLRAPGSETRHMCVGVYIGDKLRLLDVALYDSDAHYNEI